MPVIAINVTKKTYDFYHSMKKGSRSKQFNRVIERWIRVYDEHKEVDTQSYDEMALTISQLKITNAKLQTLLLESNERSIGFLEFIFKKFKSKNSE